MHRTIRRSTYDDFPAIMPVIDASRAETPLFHKKKAPLWDFFGWNVGLENCPWQ